MKFIRILYLNSSFLVFSVLNLYSQPEYSILPGDLYKWVSYLASNEMRGRANGSPEMKTAADWIAGKFKDYGLKPGLPDGGFLQRYTYQSMQGTIEERNIIGIIEGKDTALSNQYIVLSAHFDHVGIRRRSQPDSIYNGADDNAAGTCTLIAIAKAIHDSGIMPGRTLVFTAFSGEEHGMKGSRYFVANAPIQVKKIFVNLNFEMTGHSEYLGKKRYYMTGCHLSNLDEVINEHNKASDYKLIDTIQLAKHLFYGSDNIAFSRISSSGNIIKGIPGGTFATSAFAPHLHTYFDEAKLFDFENMAGLVNHFTDLVIWLSNSNYEISWTDPGFNRPE